MMSRLSSEVVPHNACRASKRDAAPTDFDDIDVMLDDWNRHLQAANRAPSTIRSYLTVGERFARFLRDQGLPTQVTDITRAHIEAWLVHVATAPNQRTGAAISAAQVAKCYRSLQQFFRWAAEEEGTVSPMAKMHPPSVPEQPVPVLADDDLRALLATCAGRSFEDRRDTALLRMLLDTGVRAAEVTNLAVDDADFDQGVAHVLGKGRRRRSAPFGPKTSEALRRYLRVRARRPDAARAELWLGAKGPLTESGVAQILERRAGDAGLRHVHPHQFRHTFAHYQFGGRRPGAGPDAIGGVAVAGDGRPVCRQRGRRAGPGCPLPAGARGQAVKRGTRSLSPG
jgi:site-specific recombinase XerD